MCFEEVDVVLWWIQNGHAVGNCAAGCVLSQRVLEEGTEFDGKDVRSEVAQTGGD